MEFTLEYPTFDVNHHNLVTLQVATDVLKTLIFVGSNLSLIFSLNGVHLEKQRRK